MTDQLSPRLPPEILSHYGEGVEQPRLVAGTSRLEFARTQIILQRFLPRPPARILDVGGGPGAWLGYVIAAVVVVHAGVSTGTGVALRADALGVYLATGALLLVFVQVFLGLLLREPSLRRRTVVRRRHVWVMAGIVALALGHIVRNSALVHRLVHW